MYNIITLGSATIDVFVDTELPEVHKGREGLIAYRVGSKILIRKIKFLAGGSAVNTAIGFSRLGLKVGCISKLGENNDSIIEILKKEGVDFLGRKVKGTGGYSIILDSKEHNRTILVYHGLNDEITFNDIDIKKARTSWFYIAATTHKSFKTSVRIIKSAKKNKTKIVLNPGTYQITLYKKEIEDILGNVEIIIFNREEAETLIGKKKNIRELLKKTASLGPPIVCITDGRKGGWVYNNSNIYFIKPHNIKVVERTGAGDAFSSGFVAGIIRTGNIEFSLQLALINAESVIRYHGAQNKLLTWNEALYKIKRTNIVIRKWK